MPGKKGRKLTPRQEKFITHYVETGNATKSAEEAGYSATSNASLRATGSENLTKPNINKAIQAQFAKHHLTRDESIQILSSHAHDQNPVISIKAVETVAKLQGYDREQQVDILERVQQVGWDDGPDIVEGEVVTDK